MPLVGTTEMFKKAYDGHYAIGAFNVNNMEIIQGIMAAAKEKQSPSNFSNPPPEKPKAAKAAAQFERRPKRQT